LTVATFFPLRPLGDEIGECFPTMTASAIGPEEVRPMMRVSIPADLPMMAGASPIRPMSCSPAAND
jgi:hypothetical protein